MSADWLTEPGRQWLDDQGINDARLLSSSEVRREIDDLYPGGANAFADHMTAQGWGRPAPVDPAQRRLPFSDLIDIERLGRAASLGARR